MADDADNGPARLARRIPIAGLTSGNDVSEIVTFDESASSSSFGPGTVTCVKCAHTRWRNGESKVEGTAGFCSFEK